ncbi:MAG: hypothetical protein HY282_13105 [Nitrospirae bacterium]|nr:hypothetical protein [Candidatus Manganitrophaceae bacterium]
MSIQQSYKVGGEITSFCTKCKLALEHIIAAVADEKIAKVQCRTCGGFHRYIDPSIPRDATPKKSKKAKADETWEKMIQLSAAKKKLPYSMTGSFKEKDVIDHLKFGLGVVTERLSWDKIQVTFKEGEKILLSKQV